MCRPANTVFLGNGFALGNPLGLPPMQRRLIQWLLVVGRTKKKNWQQHFSNWQIQHLLIKLCNDCQMALLSG
jgi:hypothetical protein